MDGGPAAFVLIAKFRGLWGQANSSAESREIYGCAPDHDDRHRVLSGMVVHSHSRVDEPSLGASPKQPTYTADRPRTTSSGGTLWARGCAAVPSI
jgi:hypothetical protein